MIVYHLHNHKLLLAQRGIEPQKNFWTYPAGFQELNESLKDGALRECLEEVGVNGFLSIRLFSVASVISTHQNHVTFLAHVDHEIQQDFEFETIQTQWFERDEINQDQLAFPIIQQNLKLFFKDLAQDKQLVHYFDLLPDKTLDQHSWFEVRDH